MKPLSETERKNIDNLGKQRALAEGGSALLDRSQRELWKVSSELQGLSTLFQALGSGADEISGCGLHGVGMTLERLSKKAMHICERLGQVVSDSPKP